MIEETKRKMYFVAENPYEGKIVEDIPTLTVRVSTKFNMLFIPGRVIDVLNMRNKWLRLHYIGSQNVIGWKVYDKLEGMGELQTKLYRFVKTNKNNTCALSVGKILKKLVNVKEDTTYMCEVKKYVERQDKLNNGEVYYYIQLKNEKSNEKDEENTEGGAVSEGAEE